MGIEIEVNGLEELCDLMCYNIIPDDENTDALIFPRAAFDYVFKLVKERLENE